jgi:hypothetical protein
MSDTAPPEGNDEDMTHTALSIARPDPVRWLWYTFGCKGALKRNMHHDQRLGIW